MSKRTPHAPTVAQILAAEIKAKITTSLLGSCYSEERIRGLLVKLLLEEAEDRNQDIKEAFELGCRFGTGSVAPKTRLAFDLGGFIAGASDR